MTDELRERIRRAAEALRQFGAREVYLFGSAAAGTLDDYSDIDMAVAGLPPEKYFKAMGAAGDILERQLDLVDLDDENLFTSYLKRKGKLQLVH
jgi:predicted nucleotidyltransferase